MDCIFCQIAEGQVPAALEHEGPGVVAFQDLSPKAPVHILIIPRRHYDSIHDVPAADIGVIGEMAQAAQAIAQAHGLWPGGYRLVFNAGPDGGQTVPHLHMHLLGGRQMLWPPG